MHANRRDKTAIDDALTELPLSLGSCAIADESNAGRVHCETEAAEATSCLDERLLQRL